jgi:CelD/BcsL family acetyltransferase involved in cellulose biosynthesis
MVVIHPLPSLAAVESVWRSLASATRHSFFLSWPWIRTWLACLPAHVKPHLMQIYEGDMAIAAGIVVKSTLHRRPMLSTRTWTLNATGDGDLDQIFIEHNGLLARQGFSEVAWNSWADSFLSDRDDWDEISLRGVPPAVLDAWQHPTIQLREEMVLIGRYVDLDHVRTTAPSVLNVLGKKKRAQIRYTQKTYSKHGPICVEVAADVAQAHEFLAELKVLHQQRWQSKQERGAFGYPFFEQFHSQLLTEHFGDGVIQLLRVRAGNQTVGVLYNFLHQGQVIVYQTGFNYGLVESWNKESPGLMTHALAIDHNLALGYHRYDLLAGDSAYKQALTDSSESLWWGRVQRRRLKFRAEDGLKTAWRYVAKELRSED